MRKPIPPLIPFLILVSAIFIAILIFAYIETKKANPQMIEVARASRPARPISAPSAVSIRAPLTFAVPAAATSTRS